MRVCPYCKEKLNKEELGESNIFVCRNEQCRYKQQSYDDGNCMRFAELPNGKRIDFSCYHPGAISDINTFYRM